jgi:hypothetical protein
MSAGEVTAFSRSKQVTPIITAGAYAANDQVGGLITLNAMGFPKNPSSLKLISVSVSDASAQSAPLEIFFFDNDPLQTSADNDPMTITDANITKCMGFVTIASGDYKTLPSNSVACRDQIMKKLYTNEKGQIFALVRTTGTPTYGATNALNIKFEFELIGAKN